MDDTKLTIKYDTSLVRLTRKYINIILMKLSYDIYNIPENIVFSTKDAEYFKNKNGRVTIAIDLNKEGIE